AFEWALEVIGSRAKTRELPELTALDESRKRLNVRSIAMVVRDGDGALRACCGREDALDAARCQRQRTLAQHVQLRGQRAQHMRLVEMVRRSDHYGVQRVQLEKILDVRKHIWNAESIREPARLGAVVVTNRNQRRPSHLRE